MAGRDPTLGPTEQAHSSVPGPDAGGTSLDNTQSAPNPAMQESSPIDNVGSQSRDAGAHSRNVPRMCAVTGNNPPRLTEFDLAEPRVALLDNDDFVGYSDQNEFVNGNGNNQLFDEVVVDTAWLDLISSVR